MVPVPDNCNLKIQKISYGNFLYRTVAYTDFDKEHIRLEKMSEILYSLVACDAIEPKSNL